MKTRLQVLSLVLRQIGIMNVYTIFLLGQRKTIFLSYQILGLTLVLTLVLKLFLGICQDWIAGKHILFGIPKKTQVVQPGGCIFANSLVHINFTCEYIMMLAVIIIPDLII